MGHPTSFAQGTNATFIENLYELYKTDPNQVDSSWQSFFAGFEFALKNAIQPETFGAQTSAVGLDHAKVEAFINAYRRLGHLSAHLNPLSEKPSIAADMLPQAQGLAGISPNQIFQPSNFGKRPLTFAEIIEQLQKTYCNHIGADFREINDIEIVTWLQEEMESCLNQPELSSTLKKRIHAKLAQAEGFEKFLHLRYLGQKRFSLEGLESLIPLLDILIDQGACHNVEEICLGMAHRGRLNVLAHIMEKPYERILTEFEGSEFNPFDIDGDVKYHLGYANEVSTFNNHNLRLYLNPNPSHLEAVNPVVEGFVRNRQETIGNKQTIMPVLLHGDASFIGQGIVHETLNLSELKDYATGGTIHIITNNQIGFTTNPTEGRSCSYSSEIAKVIRAPVFHVNADDPEAVAWIAILAVKYRQKFQKDFVIDLIGYRKHGHNETDEPGFTQPIMYKLIANHPSVYQLYSEQLITEKIYSKEEVESISSETKEKLQQAYETVKAGAYRKSHTPPKSLARIFQYRKIDRSEIMAPVNTAVSEEILKELTEKLTTVPQGFNVHPKIKRILATRASMLDGEGQIDWALAELLAYATLAKEGHPIRLSGQDCKRGTFSHRHGVLFDYETGQPFEPLNSINGAKVSIINSPLSEAGCLGFEFGYSVASPESLVLWEAQFGDFANGAQIIIDQFLLASEAKWQQCSGLVLLLPHGYEGMGPEHSSARPERFLQGCGSLNIQVANVTTPAQFFHLLRRQVIRNFRKPLVVMTPKSLLRHPNMISNKTAFTAERFAEILDDTLQNRELVEKIVMCTGKIYFDLLSSREKRSEDTSKTAIIRFEQLYPFPRENFQAIMSHYPKAKEFIWVQEEPQNMGAWSFIEPRLRAALEGQNIRYIGRKHSGSTAEGSGKSHQLEQERIIEETFAIVCGWEPKVIHGKS